MGVILTVVILVFQRPILTLFGADPTTLDMACDYVSIYALGTVFVMISLGMNSYITTQASPAPVCRHGAHREPF